MQVPLHIHRRVNQLLKQNSINAWMINRFFLPKTILLRSPDMSPGDFWFLKNNTYRQKPASLHDLKHSIRHRIHHILSDFLLSTVENMVLQLHNISDIDGGHIEQFQSYFKI